MKSSVPFNKRIPMTYVISFRINGNEIDPLLKIKLAERQVNFMQTKNFHSINHMIFWGKYVD